MKSAKNMGEGASFASCIFIRVPPLERRLAACPPRPSLFSSRTPPCVMGCWLLDRSLRDGLLSHTLRDGLLVVGSFLALWVVGSFSPPALHHVPSATS